jgi:hypothetical protein
MSAPLRIAGFIAVLGAVFALALVGGRGVGPIGDETADDGMHHNPTTAVDTSADPTDEAGMTEVPGGLIISADGYTLELARATANPGAAVPVSFQITGQAGAPVTAYDIEHEKQLHFIAVRRDVTGFQHVHPTLAADGTWSTDLALTPGDWRLFADFKPTDGPALTLRADLPVSGAYRPVTSAGEARTSVVDGYGVTIDGDLIPGTDSKLTITVTKDGMPVSDLQPYLGAYGHLVALREGDLAYLHVHPDGEPGDGVTEPGPSVVFYAAVPSVGDYRLFLDFKHGDTVRTAIFALSADQNRDPGESTAPPTDSGHTGH